jgi:PKD repeat protein
LAALPLVDFRSRAPGATDPRAVQFANLSAGEGNAYRWDFGDGEVSTEKEPLHRYRQPGRYTVTLEAQNAQGICRKRKAEYVFLAK